jgi:hypothetical protein
MVTKQTAVWRFWPSFAGWHQEMTGYLRAGLLGEEESK